MCFGIRILGPFHVATQIISFQNLNCPKMWHKTRVRTWFLDCPPADHPAIKLLVQVADVGVGHMHGGAILLSPNLLRLPPFQTLTWTWYWRRRTSTWYWRRRWYPRLFKLEELSKNHVWAMFFLFLGQFGLWMDIIWVARWNQIEILIPKHLWKSKIWLLEQK